MTVAATDEYFRRFAKDHGISDPTPGQLRCIDLVAWWLGGLHHAPRSVRECGSGIELLFAGRSFSTYDGNGLTRLVLLAHDLGIRADISARGMTLSVALHPRKIREGGSGWDRHPTIDSAIAAHRETFTAQWSPVSP